MRDKEDLGVCLKYEAFCRILVVYLIFFCCFVLFGGLIQQCSGFTSVLYGESIPGGFVEPNGVHTELWSVACKANVLPTLVCLQPLFVLFGLRV